MFTQPVASHPLSVTAANVKLNSEIGTLLEVGGNITQIAAGINVEAERDEARSKLRSVILGLEYLRERI